MATGNADGGESVSSTAHDIVTLEDVLSGIELQGSESAGASLTFHTVGDSTVISIDVAASGPVMPHAVLTLAHVTGKTLQELLSDISP